MFEINVKLSDTEKKERERHQLRFRSFICASE